MGRAADESVLGRTIAGKYQIESFLGGGAMGSVYKAQQKEIDKAVAVKILHRELLIEPQFAARFKREAKAASRLDHPNSLRVLDYGEEPDGLCYMVMELLEGQSLFQIIRHGDLLAKERIVDLLRQTLAALAVAHEMGVVHRDLKPENIIVLQSPNDEGGVTEVVKVCDFGMAKISANRHEQTEHPSEKLTSHGVVVGTPEYMSPEQGRGETLDGRSDVYSVGVILYQMLAGRLPFQAETAVGVLLKHLVEEPVPPSTVAADVDPALEAICLKAMQKRREDRYASAREMRADLAAAAKLEGPPRSQAYPRPSAAESRRIGEAATVQLTAPQALAAPTTTPRPISSSRAVIRARDLVGEPDAVPQTRVVPALLGVLVLAAGVAFAILWATKPQVLWATFPGLRRLLAPPAAAVPAATAGVAPLPSSSVSPSAAVSAAPPSPSSSASAGPPSSGAPAASSPPSTSASAIASAGRPPIRSPAGLGGRPPPSQSSGTSSGGGGEVVVGGVHADRASSVAVLSALPMARYTQCYRDALHAGSLASGVGSLHLEIDSGGAITQATFQSAVPLGGTGDCIAAATKGRTIQVVEGAPSTADVALSFKAD